RTLPTARWDWLALYLCVSMTRSFRDGGPIHSDSAFRTPRGVFPRRLAHRFQIYPSGHEVDGRTPGALRMRRTAGRHVARALLGSVLYCCDSVRYFRRRNNFPVSLGDQIQPAGHVRVADDAGFSRDLAGRIRLVVQEGRARLGLAVRNNCPYSLTLIFGVC